MEWKTQETYHVLCLYNAQWKTFTNQQKIPHEVRNISTQKAENLSIDRKQMKSTCRKGMKGEERRDGWRRYTSTTLTSLRKNDPPQPTRWSKVEEPCMNDDKFYEHSLKIRMQRSLNHSPNLHILVCETVIWTNWRPLLILATCEQIFYGQLHKCNES